MSRASFSTTFKAASFFAVGVTLVVSSSAFAQRYANPSDRPDPRSPLEVWISGEGWDEDYQSSDVCVAGYRWITRNTSHQNQSAAADAYPVRC